MFDYSTGKFNIIKQLELVSITRENQPNVYGEGSPLAQLQDLRGLLTPANRSEIIL